MTGTGFQGLPHPVPVPEAWRARGFSGRYAATVTLPGPDAAALPASAPCLLRDQAWLLLAAHPAPGAAVTVVLVRLDAAALVDLSARRPSPGAYRAPDARAE